MSRQNKTRQNENRKHILKIGAGIIYRKGFHHTGIQQILSESGIPKGSFYYYFRNKSDFGVALIDHIGSDLQRMYDRFFNDESLTPLERFNAYFQWACRYYQTCGYTGGCPIGNLAQEMGDLDSAMQKKLADVIGRMIARFAEMLELASDSGELSADIDTKEAAGMVFACWEGALLHMKVVKSSAPLKTAHKQIFEHILGKPAREKMKEME